MSTTRSRRVLMLAILLVFVSACASQEPQIDLQAESQGPIERALGIADSQGDLIGQVQLRGSVAAEERIQLCMRARGFEYQPEPADIRTRTAPPGQGLSREEFADQYGLGIVRTLIDSYADGAFADGLDLDADLSPNQRILNSLSDSEQIEWNLALNGAGALQEDVDRDVVGCRDEFGATQNAVISEFIGLAFEIDERVRNHPDVIDAEQDWSRCMNLAGFTYATQREMEDQWYAETQAAISNAADQTGSDLSSPDEVEELVVVALEPLVEKELAIAAADFECGEQLASELEAAEVEVERDLAAENHELLSTVSDLISPEG